MPAKRYVTVKQAAESYPVFSESALRYLIFNKDKNGLDHCLRRIGSKIIIDCDKFEEWIEGKK